MSDNIISNDTLLGMAKNNLTIAREMYKLSPHDKGNPAYHPNQDTPESLSEYAEM